jgi:hypothetical protein
LLIWGHRQKSTYPHPSIIRQIWILKVPWCKFEHISMGRYSSGLILSYNIHCNRSFNLNIASVLGLEKM